MATFYDQGGLPSDSGTFNYLEGPFIFRVQTVPHIKGVLEFIVDFRRSDLGSFTNVFKYNTTKPYPITYAVFGSRNTSAADYTIRDGIKFNENDNLLTFFSQLIDCLKNFPLLTAERATTQA